ncbi:DUF4236 domain-containing protein [Weissella bombi]|uniref:DUF4236 domain-containing protein n=1 Tax=Weissella bombi TaxID=1505725 RepID=A0A1C3YUS4_9LACO|nr:DUF4236 domain-containing protein [Weissella bombi]SCB73871.1 Protein of unknown function [Weissella bombi]
MGFRYRKSKNFGPFRINFSKSGIGWSVGGKGFRYTKKANGGIQTTTSIPGSGMSWVKDYSNKTTSPNNQKNIVNLHTKQIDNVDSTQQVLNKKIISTKWLIIIAFLIIFIGLFFV